MVWRLTQTHYKRMDALKHPAVRPVVKSLYLAGVWVSSKYWRWVHKFSPRCNYNNSICINSRSREVSLNQYKYSRHLLMNTVLKTVSYWTKQMVLMVFTMGNFKITHWTNQKTYFIMLGDPIIICFTFRFRCGSYWRSPRY